MLWSLLKPEFLRNIYQIIFLMMNMPAFKIAYFKIQNPGKSFRVQVVSEKFAGQQREKEKVVVFE